MTVRLLVVALIACAVGVFCFVGLCLMFGATPTVGIGS